MITIDLFSGAGGLSTGLQKAGFDVRAAVEMNPAAAGTYALNHNNVTLLRKDLVQLTPEEFLAQTGLNGTDITLVAGGPPCQGFSMANGHSRNHENPALHEKNQLVYRFIDFVRHIQPRFFLMENVLGFLPLQAKFEPSIVDRFKQIGYENTAIFVLDAANYGVPQHRQRVFVIGSRSAGKKFQVPPKSVMKYITVGEALFGDLPVIRKGAGWSEPVDYKKEAETEYQHYLRECSEKAANHLTTNSGPTVLARFKKIAQGKNGLSLGTEIGISIQFTSCYRRLKSSEPSITMSNFRKSMIIHPTQNRILTVREAARLQSFQDRYVFTGGLNSMQQQVGDAVPPRLAEAVGRVLAGMV